MRASASACAASRVIACGSTPSQPRVTSPSLMICVEHRARERHRDREADAHRAARLREDRAVDADQVAGGVDQRAAGIARIDRRIGLDEVLEAVDAEVIAAERADDARASPCCRSRTGCRSRARRRRPAACSVVPKVIVGRSSPSAFSTARSVSGSTPFTRARELTPSASTTSMSSAPSIDVVVGEHVAFGRDDDAGAEARRAALRRASASSGKVAAQDRVVEQRVARAHRLAGVDVDDGRHRLLRRVRVARGAPASRRRGGVPAQQHDVVALAGERAAADQVAASRRRTARARHSVHACANSSQNFRSTRISPGNRADYSRRACAPPGGQPTRAELVPAADAVRKPLFPLRNLRVIPMPGFKSRTRIPV